MHTLFTLEDRYGLRVDEMGGDMEGEVCLRVDPRSGADAAKLHEMLYAWRQAAAMLDSGEISREEYDRWRYFYPEFDTTGRWAKAPPQEFSDMLIEEFQKQHGEPEQ